MSTLIHFNRSGWMPPEDLTLSQWAEKHFYLSAESSAEAGRFRPYPYQYGIMDALTDPLVDKVSLMKSARVGATKIINALTGYHMHQDPCPIMIVQPTVEDSEGYSKEEITPMIRDCPVLARLFDGSGGTRVGADTILSKRFPGGSVSMGGSNSGRVFRRVSRRIVCLDEVDAYAPSAGADGDQIKLAERRTEHYHDRKIYLCSTPLLEGVSRITDAFMAGDQRYFFVPCYHCGHFDKLQFFEEDAAESGGHWLRWPDKSPEKAHFVCQNCNGEIYNQRKRDFIDPGEWRASAPQEPVDGGKIHASFHIWAGYSYSPNARWGQIAQEFVASKGTPQKLRTFINTVLGKTWHETGDVPDYQSLFDRREDYAIGTVPDGVLFLTAGVDVQKESLRYEVVGWGYGKESWSIECGILPGNTSRDEVWKLLEEVLLSKFEGANGISHSISLMAVDSGAWTNTVYSWCRKFPMSRVVAVKGVHTAKVLVGSSSSVDVTSRGKTIKGGYKIFPVSSDIAKAEIYGFLPLRIDDDGYRPTGLCHFPKYEMNYFMEITAEHLIEVKNSKGFPEMQWQLLPGRENHFLDCRVYARVAAALKGIDRMRAREPVQDVKIEGSETSQRVAPAPVRAPKKAKRKRERSSFWD